MLRSEVAALLEVSPPRCRDWQVVAETGCCTANVPCSLGTSALFTCTQPHHATIYTFPRLEHSKCPALLSPPAHNTTLTHESHYTLCSEHRTQYRSHQQLPRRVTSFNAPQLFSRSAQFSCARQLLPRTLALCVRHTLQNFISCWQQPCPVFS